MKIISLFLTLVISTSVYASDCTTCVALEEATNTPIVTTQDLKRVQNLLLTFELSKDSAVRSQEVEAYLQLVLKARDADPTSISEEYFYNFYDLNRNIFNAEIKKMSSEGKAEIIESIKGVGELRKSDKID